MWLDATPASMACSRVTAASSTCPITNRAVPRVVSRALCQYPLPLRAARDRRRPQDPARVPVEVRVDRTAGGDPGGHGVGARPELRRDGAALGGLQPVVGLVGAPDLLQGGGLDQGEPRVSVTAAAGRPASHARIVSMRARSLAGIQWSRISVAASAMSPAAVACRMASDGVP